MLEYVFDTIAPFRASITRARSARRAAAPAARHRTGHTDDRTPAPNMSNRKTALITGSTSGIGLGIAEAFVAHGMNVMLNGFGPTDEIDATTRRLDAAGDGNVVYNGADMTEPDQIAAMIGACTERFGGIDILVNNAGIQHVGAIEEFPPQKWDAIIAINLSSAFHTIRAALPGMKQRGWGRIINIASAHALVASPYKSAYVAAKHGVLGLTRTVALEAAETGVTVNAICPGYVLTPLVERQIPDTAKARGISEEQVKRDVLLSAQPTKKFVTTEQIGALSLFLAGDEAASITGAALPVDGGWTAH
jgi:3-hydroxybutyrate dehydrogenase